MQLRTLGGLALRGVSFERPKPLLLLAYLALEGAKSRPHLAELFWPTAAEPLNSLRVALSQLRSVAPDIVEEGEHGLATSVDTDAAGLLRALDADDPAAVDDAYRGDFLANFRLAGLGSELEEWICSTREVLADRAQEVLLRRAERAAGEGRFAEAAQRARTALEVADTPGPERLDRFHLLLVAGNEPGATRLQRLAGEYGLTLSATPAEARRRLLQTGGTGVVPHNLPARPSSFVGRDPELIELTRLLARPEVRLVTLSGPGGVGKTRLALEAARLARRESRYRDGVHFVALDTLGEPALVPGAIASAVGSALGSGEGPDELASALGSDHRLLVLDGFERLTGAAAGLSALLRACPHLELLVTSRERLDLEGEQVFVLEGLPLPPDGLDASEAMGEDAVQLFLRRAKSVRLDFELTPATLPHVLDICRLTRGLPLGIELAAVWVRALPVADIAAEIADNLDFLSVSAPDVAERHRSLRATFEHSWQLLDSREQQVLRQLSVFVGDFSREAAALVAGATIPLLASLVDRSLLRMLDDDRYDRHPLLSLYTREKLAEHPDERAAALERHDAFFAALAVEAEEGLKGSGQEVWLERLSAEQDHLRSVLDRAAVGDAGQVRRGLQLAGGLWQYWHILGHLREGRERCDRLLAAPTAGAAGAERAKALSGAGVLAFAQGDHAASRDYHAEALAIRRRLDLPLAAARSLYNLGSVAGAQGDLESAKAYVEQSLAVFREHGDPWTVALSLTNVATLASRLGRSAEAAALHEESLRLRRSLGDRHGVAAALRNVAALAQLHGDRARARRLLGESLTVTAELGDQLGLATTLEAIATLAADEGGFERAVQLWSAATELREGIGASVPPDEAPERERRLSEARARLGSAGFRAAWRSGAREALDDIMASLHLDAGEGIGSDGR